ncbi:MAG: formylglycine-generating enzyme family protein [Pseudomonadota bacterium]
MPCATGSLAPRSGDTFYKVWRSNDGLFLSVRDIAGSELLPPVLLDPPGSTHEGIQVYGDSTGAFVAWYDGISYGESRNNYFCRYPVSVVAVGPDGTVGKPQVVTSARPDTYSFSKGPDGVALMAPFDLWLDGRELNYYALWCRRAVSFSFGADMQPTVSWAAPRLADECVEPKPNSTDAAVPGVDAGGLVDAVLVDGADDANCQPKACAEQSKNCGTISDGCGGVLSCGSCISPEFCGGAGANVCGAVPSCAGLAPTCGSSGSENCCDTLLIPGGTFDRSGSASHYATVSSFLLDRYEITVGRFRAFVDAGMGTQENPPEAGAGAHSRIADSGWDSAWNANLPADTAALKEAFDCSSTFQTWTDTAAANESLPMNCLDWFEVFAFCAWDGGRLPTETEWTYAAAGGSEQRDYPWGSEGPNGTYAAYECLGDGSEARTCAFSDIFVVGSRSPKGDGRWGQADLGGNMCEWTLDWYASWFECGYPIPCVDCACLTPTAGRSFRGGAFSAVSFTLHPSWRDFGNPSGRREYLGGRCARAL